MKIIYIVNMNKIWYFMLRLCRLIAPSIDSNDLTYINRSIQVVAEIISLICVYKLFQYIPTSPFYSLILFGVTWEISDGLSRAMYSKRYRCARPPPPESIVNNVWFFMVIERLIYDNARMSQLSCSIHAIILIVSLRSIYEQLQ